MADVRPIIEGAVRAALGSVPIEKIDFVVGHDHADEEAYYVVVEVPASAPQGGGQRLIAAITGANSALLAAGDRRFPYVRIRCLGEEEADEGDTMESPAP